MATNFKPAYTSVARVTDHILDKIENKSPFSCVRFVHCEPRFMGFPDYFNRRNVDWSLELQLGHSNFNHGQIEEIRDGINKSFRSADIVGLPIHRSDYNKGDLMNSNFGEYLERSVVEIANGLELFRPDQIFVTHNIHLDWLTNNTYEKFLKSHGKVSFITGRDIKNAFEDHFGVAVEDDIRVPAESAYVSGYVDSLSTREHYPFVYRDIISHLNKPQHGRLYLLGAGFLGKIYSEVIRRNGGSVLDIGSIFDIWARVPSRVGHTEDRLGKYSLKTVSDKAAIKPKSSNQLLPPLNSSKYFDRIPGGGKIWSVVSAGDNLMSAPTHSLTELLCKGLIGAQNITFSQAKSCGVGSNIYLNRWPGEHFRLLAGLLDEIRPAAATVIGHQDGLTTKAILQSKNPSTRVYHFRHPINVVENSENQNKLQTIFFKPGESSPFDQNKFAIVESGLVVLGDDLQVADWRNVLQICMEKANSQSQYIFLNGIYKPTFREFWSQLTNPRLDVSGLGHWTGSGIIEI